jgi:hypothetical protein
MRLALSIDEFCRSIGVSRPMFYLLKRQNRAPAVMSVGHRKLISIEEAQRWVRAQSAVSATAET